MIKDRKAQIGQLQNLIIPLVGIGIVLAIGFLILAEVKDQTWAVENNASAACSKTTGENCSYGVNASIEIQKAMDDIPGWLPIIIITVVGVILLGLVALFRGRR